MDEPVLGPDGAASGLTARDALGMLVGGEAAPPKEKRVNLAEYLDTSPMPVDWSDGIGSIVVVGTDDGYSLTCRVMGKLILDFMREHPECEQMPAENVYDWSDFHGEGIPPVIATGVWDYIKDKDAERGNKLSACGATGFMYGWAVNAARTAMGWGPVANPAILTINVGEVEPKE